MKVAGWIKWIILKQTWIISQWTKIVCGADQGRLKAWHEKTRKITNICYIIYGLTSSGQIIRWPKLWNWTHALNETSLTSLLQGSSSSARPHLRSAIPCSHHSNTQQHQSLDNEKKKNKIQYNHIKRKTFKFYLYIKIITWRFIKC